MVGIYQKRFTISDMKCYVQKQNLFFHFTIDLKMQVITVYKKVVYTHLNHRERYKTRMIMPGYAQVHNLSGCEIKILKSLNRQAV